MPFAALRESGSGTNRKCRRSRYMSAIESNAEDCSQRVSRLLTSSDMVPAEQPSVMVGPRTLVGSRRFMPTGFSFDHPGAPAAASFWL
jgi:hypothetical protein